MGQEVTSSHFQKQDFASFASRLREETALLQTWFEHGEFDNEHRVGGFEIEAWLIDRDYKPAPINATFLEHVNSPMVVPELSQFNVEINTEPQALQGKALSTMYKNLKATWGHCRKVARKLESALVMVGILPTVRDTMLTLENISHWIRFRALNEQLLRQRKGVPFTLDIHGRDGLEMSHQDVMLEAAATSFQVHLQVPQAESVRAFNASLILSAPTVAVAANSPYLFGLDLWDESRIPLFEQAVAVNAPATSVPNRVFFGQGYAEDSLFQLFADNLDQFPLLLPKVEADEPASAMHHVRLHNGTIWRWNRPLIGFAADGRPHLRVEHRVMAAGTSVIDTIANAAFYYGLVYALTQMECPPENQLPFKQVRANFYAAAKHSLRAQVTWLDGREVPLQALIVEELIPLAREGLLQQGVNKDDVARFMDIMESRVRNWCTGTAWQRSFVESHGADMEDLTAAYLECQHSGKPVHEWEI